MIADVFEDPNPFGPATETDIVAFETEIGWRLPPEYRGFLLSHNGAAFRKDIYYLTDDPWDSVRLHHVYGLHDEPDWARLATNWRLSDYYDLQNWRWNLGKFLTFADTCTGDLLNLNLKNGSVWFYDHDVEPRFLRMPGRLRKVEESFRSFLSKLRTQEENDTLLEGDPRQKAFLEQLAVIEARRAREQNEEPGQ